MLTMDWIKEIFVELYFLVLVALALYGLHRYYLLYLYYHHHDKKLLPAGRLENLPVVTVQLPLYNEQYVVRRIISATAVLDYPRELLEIQVLDDSVDETCAIARAEVEKLCAAGADVKYFHRTERKGFKAGALSEGLAAARGELLAIFDADFVPQPDFLKKVVPYFSDAAVGMVQVRWTHCNRDLSLLTRGQAVLLDGHFQIENTARNCSGRFFNFNGTGGIWRREAIVSSGGWQADTLTEDMDISYRAQMAGWKFVFLPDVTAPAELPMDINAFKSQQRRWAKGAIQTAKKLLPAVWRSDQPLKVKLEATFHLSNGLAHVFIMSLSLMLFPAIWLRGITGVGTGLWKVALIDFPLFVLATASASAFYVASQRELYPDWKRVFRYLPFLTALGIGISLSNAKGVLEGLFGRTGVFERTAKHGVTRRSNIWKRSAYRSRPGLLLVGEILFTVYFASTILLAVTVKNYASLPFLFLFFAGYLYVSTSSILQSFRGRTCVIL